MIYAANQTVAPADRQRAAARTRQARPRRAAIDGRHPDRSATPPGSPNLDDISVWLGLVAPKGTPQPIVDKINAEVVQILGDPGVREKSERTGNYPVTNTPEQFSAFIRREADRWSRVIKDTGIKLD